jgi:hypothetical protein
MKARVFTLGQFIGTCDPQQRVVVERDGVVYCDCAISKAIISAYEHCYVGYVEVVDGKVILSI